MTRLLNAERAAIRRDILSEVPLEDYAGKIAKRALDLAILNLPPGARRLWEVSQTRGLLSTHTCYFGYSEGRRRYTANVNLPGFEDYHATIKEDPLIVEWVDAEVVQRDKYDALDASLKNNLASVGTHEEFTKRWPELARFLPDGSAAKVENLPATTVLLDELKAAGLKV